MTTATAALPVFVARTPTPLAGHDDWTATVNLASRAVIGRGPTERDAREHLRTQLESELWRARAALTEVEAVLADRGALLTRTGPTL